MQTPSPSRQIKAHAALASRLARASPHTFTIQYPPSRAYFQQHFSSTPPVHAVSPSSLQLNAHDALLLYVHVPFCEQRCFYCNFAVDLRKSRGLHARYVEALARQVGELTCQLAHLPRQRLDGLDIGGGTPTRLDPDLLERLLVTLSPWVESLKAGARASIETTPSIASSSPEKLALLVDHGIKRLSIGVQSTHDETLAHVNRRRQRALADAALDAALNAGFERVSVDLVFGLPNQTASMWREDLDRVLAHGVDAITIYDCLYRGAGRALPGLSQELRPTMTTYGELYDLAYDKLIMSGFHGQYGGVNFSRRAGEHGTSDYFTHRLLHGDPYLGLGNYASSSLADGRWWFAPYEVDAYIESIHQGHALPALGGHYALPAEEHAAKAMLASLNFGRIHADTLKRRYPHEYAHTIAPKLDVALERGLLAQRAREHTLYVPRGYFVRLPELRALLYSVQALEWTAAHLDLCSP